MPTSHPRDDILRPPFAIQARLALRIAAETGEATTFSLEAEWREPDWEQIAPRIECKILSCDDERARVSMLVRLEPGARYPAHTHVGDEELFLLEGELMIDDRRLVPGSYNHGSPGASDESVWSATGCICLLITSTEDVLR